MTAIADLRRKAEEKYPSYPIELDAGTLVLTGIMSLSDEQLTSFTKAQAELSKLDEGTDMLALKNGFVDLFAGVANNPDLARSELPKEDLGVLAVILEEYAGALNAGSKSEDAS